MFSQKMMFVVEFQNSLQAVPHFFSAIRMAAQQKLSLCFFTLYRIYFVIILTL